MNLRGLRRRMDRLTANHQALPCPPPVVVFDFDDDSAGRAKAEADIARAKADGRDVLLVQFAGAFQDGGVVVEQTDERGARKLLS